MTASAIIRLRVSRWSARRLVSSKEAGVLEGESSLPGKNGETLGVVGLEETGFDFIQRENCDYLALN